MQLLKWFSDITTTVFQAQNENTFFKGKSNNVHNNSLKFYLSCHSFYQLEPFLSNIYRSFYNARRGISKHVIQHFFIAL